MLLINKVKAEQAHKIYFQEIQPSHPCRTINLRETLDNAALEFKKMQKSFTAAIRKRQLADEEKANNYQINLLKTQQTLPNNKNATTEQQLL